MNPARGQRSGSGRHTTDHAWNGKDFAVTTEIVKLGDVEIAVRVPDLPDPWSRRFIAGVVACEPAERAANGWLGQPNTFSRSQTGLSAKALRCIY